MLTMLQVAANALQIVLAMCIVVVMAKNRFVRRFRWFFAYACFQVFEGGFRWLLFWKAGPAAYYSWYWRTALLDMALTFIALAESWLHVFRIFLELVWFRVLVGALASVMLGVSWWAVWTHPRQDRDWILATILQLDLSFTYIPLTASFLYFWLVRFFGITGNGRESGVMLGFMTDSTFSLIGVGLRTIFGLQTRILGIPAGNFASWVPVIGYLLSEVIWLFTFIRPVLTPVEGRRMLTVGEINERLGKYLDVLSRIARKE